MDSRTDPPIFTAPLSESETLLLAIVEAVATVENVQSTSLAPLSRTVDTEALARVVETGDSTLRVSFDYEGYHVVVTTERVELY